MSSNNEDTSNQCTEEEGDMMGKEEQVKKGKIHPCKKAPRLPHFLTISSQIAVKL
jgi:hypothetical protein